MEPVPTAAGMETPATAEDLTMVWRVVDFLEQADLVAEAEATGAAEVTTAT